MTSAAIEHRLAGQGDRFQKPTRSEGCCAVGDRGDTEVRGSVGVRVNGEPAGVVFCAPWTLPVRLRDGENVLELEVASTLGPLAGRGIPTPFGPEDQRFAGILGRPRLVVPA